jgi:hypothetical protein
MAAEAEARKPRCCWPKCGSPLFSEIPLCAAHLDIAARMGRKLAAGEEVVFRHTAIVSPETIPERVPKEGFVYYVRSGGFIKIGWTSDLTKRMKGYPPDSLLLAVEPGTRQLETRRHRQFSHHRSHGREWYTMAPTLTHHIESVKAEHGTPDPVDFAAKPVGIPQPRQRQTIGRPTRGNQRAWRIA